MIEKRKRRKNAGDVSFNEDAWKPTTEELEVTRYLYKKLPSKDGRLSGMVVRTFNPVEAIDLLLESPWAKIPPSSVNSKNAKPRLFASQAMAVAYMDTLLQKQVFQRALCVKKKSVSKPREESKVTKVKSKRTANETKAKEPVSETPLSADQQNPTTDFPSPEESAEDKDAKHQSASVVSTSLNTPTPTVVTKSNSSSSSKPMRLELAQEQMFVLDDPLTVYVWIYEPPPGLFNWLAGSALLVGVILCCLFPIWPVQLRTGAYYLTLCASGLFGLLLALAVVRLGLYLLVWLVTKGNYGFWLFPNYFEDCGFFESFRPIYSFTSIDSKTLTKKEKVKNKSSSSGKTDAIKQSTNSQSLSSLPCTSPSDVDADASKDLLGKLD
ncbi:hypothetical protein EG68_03554 [Paragonimus skrjabini miyazakii]|uniref:Translocation protein SEC62 n=1 Tax=Paragonimus skrjabini miyazakii TaxID=59628 RepID=A0A8S9Z0I5_9TREM|nr:hypothetical protein EG68_03554 [Paragonimus skrjabini miyazakii]